MLPRPPRPPPTDPLSPTRRSSEPQSFHPDGLLAALPHIQERTQQVAHHMVQESIGLECEQEIIAMLNNVQCLQGTHRTGRLALRRSKTAEVMFAQQRSEERRVGKECVSTCRSRWTRYH